MNVFFKKIGLIFILAVSLFLFACSGDDDGATSVGTTGGTSNFFPITIGNYWTYDTEVTDPQTSVITQGRDSLYIAGTTTISGLEYVNLDASATSTGFMTGLLSENNIRSANDKLYVHGNLNFDLSVVGGSLHAISLNNAILFDALANNGTELYSAFGVITDPVIINGQTALLTINYTVKTIQRESFTNYDVNGVNFLEVLKSDFIISAQIDAQITVAGFPVNVNVAPMQDINVIENYYATDYGLIDSYSNFSLNLDATIAAQLGVSQNTNIPSNQEIDTFFIN